MNEERVTSQPLPEFELWEKTEKSNTLLSFMLEITARCNNSCRHCYINLPADDANAKRRELRLGEIDRIGEEAVSLGSLWCLVTGGEPLLRPDFPDIFILLKKKGLLVSVFTNACLISPEHIRLFKAFPPRAIEVSVYGVTPETYEGVTRKPGSFRAFTRGLDLLFDHGIPVRFKTMALRSNVHEHEAIADFCRKRTRDYFRFDPMIHLRFDGDEARNAEIRAERLTAEEIVVLERQDPDRFRSLKNGCDSLILPELAHRSCSHVFYCGVGKRECAVGYDGTFRLCSDLWHPSFTANLRETSLAEAYRELVPRVRELTSDREAFLEKCRKCPIFNLCLWCPARAHLETGEMDMPVDYFCGVAHARAEAIR